MLIQLQNENKTFTTQAYAIRIDGRLFGYGIQNLSDTMPAGIYQLVMLNGYPVIMGMCNFSDEGLNDGNLVVGELVGDDFIIGTRPAFAKFCKAVIEALDNLETITVEVE